MSGEEVEGKDGKEGRWGETKTVKASFTAELAWATRQLETERMTEVVK